MQELHVASPIDLATQDILTNAQKLELKIFRGGENNSIN
jgi:hypothetical protein